MYLALTATGQYYCGVSTDVTKRIATHNAGRGAKWLRGSRLPVREVWRVANLNHGSALRLEAAVKRLPSSLKASVSATM